MQGKNRIMTESISIYYKLTMHNPTISKIRTHLLQLLTKDRSANPEKKKERKKERKRVTERGISSSVMCPLVESRFRNKNTDIKSPSLCLETASTISNLLKRHVLVKSGDFLFKYLKELMPEEAALISSD